jgi:hypothetical protein
MIIMLVDKPKGMYQLDQINQMVISIFSELGYDI